MKKILIADHDPAFGRQVGARPALLERRLPGRVEPPPTVQNRPPPRQFFLLFSLLF
jgi:hypothetical protein